MAPARAGPVLWDALDPRHSPKQALAPTAAAGSWVQRRTCRWTLHRHSRAGSCAMPQPLPGNLPVLRVCSPCRGPMGHQTAPAEGEQSSPTPAETLKCGQGVQRAPLGSHCCQPTRARGYGADTAYPSAHERACVSPRRQPPAFHAFLRRTRLVGHSSAGGFSPAELLCCQTHPGLAAARTAVARGLGRAAARAAPAIVAVRYRGCGSPSALASCWGSSTPTHVAPARVRRCRWRGIAAAVKS